MTYSLPERIESIATAMEAEAKLAGYSFRSTTASRQAQRLHDLAVLLNELAKELA